MGDRPDVEREPVRPGAAGSAGCGYPASGRCLGGTEQRPRPCWLRRRRRSLDVMDGGGPGTGGGCDAGGGVSAIHSGGGATANWLVHSQEPVGLRHGTQREQPGEASGGEAGGIPARQRVPSLAPAEEARRRLRRLAAEELALQPLHQRELGNFRVEVGPVEPSSIEGQLGQVPP